MPLSKTSRVDDCEEAAFAFQPEGDGFVIADSVLEQHPSFEPLMQKHGSKELVLNILRDAEATYDELTRNGDPTASGEYFAGASD